MTSVVRPGRRARVLGGGASVAAALLLTACGLGGGNSQATSTLPTLPPSSGATTAPPTTPAPPPSTTAPPLTAPIGGPNTLPPDPGLVTTAPTTTIAEPRITYVNEPANGALQLGHKGPRVQSLQAQLRALGYQLGVDGYFGRGTEGVVRQFQAAQGLPVDGIAGPSTLERLSQVAPPTG